LLSSGLFPPPPKKPCHRALQNLKSYLIEINANPSMRIDYEKDIGPKKVEYLPSPIDEAIKIPMMSDTLRILTQISEADPVPPYPEALSAAPSAALAASGPSQRRFVRPLSKGAEKQMLYARSPVSGKSGSSEQPPTGVVRTAWGVSDEPREDDARGPQPAQPAQPPLCGRARELGGYVDLTPWLRGELRECMGTARVLYHIFRKYGGARADVRTMANSAYRRFIRNCGKPPDGRSLVSLCV
jgi:hypothetical protein